MDIRLSSKQAAILNEIVTLDHEEFQEVSFDHDGEVFYQSDYLVFIDVALDHQIEFMNEIGCHSHSHLLCHFRGVSIWEDVDYESIKGHLIFVGHSM